MTPTKLDRERLVIVVDRREADDFVVVVTVPDESETPS